MEKMLIRTLLEFLLRVLQAGPGEIEQLVLLTASDICYQLRKESHKI